MYTEVIGMTGVIGVLLSAAIVIGLGLCFIEEIRKPAGVDVDDE